MVPRWDAIVFDVDGTLYHAWVVRSEMALRLAGRTIQSPRRGARTIAVLRAYRQALEALRQPGLVRGTVRGAQLEETARRSGVTVAEVGAIVDHWFMAVPSQSLLRARRPHLVSCLARARALGIRLAVMSDYEPTRKLQALDIAGFFDVVVHADDPDVRALKPSPRGIEVVLNRLGVAPSRAAYVGDRRDVDVLAAERAGVTPVLLRRAQASGTITVSGFRALAGLLADAVR